MIDRILNQVPTCIVDYSSLEQDDQQLETELDRDGNISKINLIQLKKARFFVGS